MSSKFYRNALQRYQNFRQLMTINIISFGSRKPKPISMAYRAFEGTDIVGNTAPLVVVHDLFASKRQWKNMSRAIQENAKPTRKVIAVDIRNHGDSPHSPYHTYAHLAEDIVNFLKENDIDRAALLGHSVGGRAVMYTALKYPQVVERIIVVDGSPISTSNTFLQLESVFPRLKSITINPELSIAEGRDTMKRQLAKTIHNEAMLDFILKNIKKTEGGRFLWGQNIHVLHTNFKNMAHFPIEDVRGYQYRGPALFISGSKSDFLKVSEFEDIKRFFPKAELQLMDSGHDIHTEYPSEFAKTVVSFINQS